LSSNLEEVKVAFQLARSDDTRSKPDWQRLYLAAVLEVDRSKLPQRIRAAKAAILERLRHVESQEWSDGKEQAALNRALFVLELLR
jgi:hypothetical protein